MMMTAGIKDPDRGKSRRAEPTPPRVLAFCQDAVDDDGNQVEWEQVAWGLHFADGTALSISVSRPASVTLWLSLEHALEGLDASLYPVDPRRRLRLDDAA